MAELATLARPYANAVFGTAKSSGDGLDRWSRMLGLLAATVAEDAVRRVIESPAVSAEAKAFRLCELGGDELNERARNFVGLLAANHRLGLLPEIVRQFEALKDLEEEILDVEIVSAFDLDDSDVQGLKDRLTKRFQREVVITSDVDAALIGGVVIRAGDTVIDGSVRGRLNRLTEALKQS